MFIQKLKIYIAIFNIINYDVYFTDKATKKSIKLEFNKSNECVVYREFSLTSDNYVEIILEKDDNKTKYEFSLGNCDEYKSKISLRLINNKIYINSNNIHSEFINETDIYSHYYIDDGKLHKS